MLPLANLIMRLGRLTAVLVGLALCAVIQLEVNGYSMIPAVRQQRAAARPHPTAKASRPAAVTLLIRQVRATVSEQRAMLVRRAFGVQDVPQPDVHLVRIDRAGGWAFGTCAVPPPAGMDAMPQSSMFVARRSGRNWQIALSGTEGFERLVRQAPVTLIPTGQRPFLEQYGKATARGGNASAGLALPWRTGQSWTVQSMAGVSGLHFAGGDGRVLASGVGRLYRLCARSPNRGMLMLIHPNGMASEYYQVADITDVKDGTLVEQGEYIGRISTDRPCGGPPAKGRTTASFALLDGYGAVSLNGAQIGGWTLHTSEGRFYADRSGVRVDSGNPLLNFGPDAAPSSTPHPATASPDPQSS
jgi:LasA protease